jgi:hypothetical protein
LETLWPAGQEEQAVVLEQVMQEELQGWQP